MANPTYKSGNNTWTAVAIGEGIATVTLHGASGDWVVADSVPTEEVGGVIIAHQDKPFSLVSGETLYIKAPAGTQIVTHADNPVA